MVKKRGVGGAGGGGIISIFHPVSISDIWIYIHIYIYIYIMAKKHTKTTPNQTKSKVNLLWWHGSGSIVCMGHVYMKRKEKRGGIYFKRVRR